MMFSLFYIDNIERLSVDELKQSLETDQYIMGIVDKDVVKSSFVYVPYGDYDYIVLADVQRDGGRWKPIQSTHLRIGKHMNDII